MQTWRCAFSKNVRSIMGKKYSSALFVPWSKCSALSLSLCCLKVLTEFSGPDFCSVLAYVSSAKCVPLTVFSVTVKEKKRFNMSYYFTFLSRDPAFVSSIVNVAKPLNKRFGDVGRECSITDLAVRYASKV